MHARTLKTQQRESIRQRTCWMTSYAKTLMSSTGSVITRNIGVRSIIQHSWMQNAVIYLHNASHELHSSTLTNTYTCTYNHSFPCSSCTYKQKSACAHATLAVLCLQGPGYNELHYHKADVEWCCSTHACPLPWRIKEKVGYIILKASPVLLHFIKTQAVK